MKHVVRKTDSASSLPLIVTPESLGQFSSSPSDILAWLPENRDWIENQLIKHGGILFRGFHLGSCDRLAAFREAAGYAAMKYYRGVSERTPLGKDTYTATETVAFVAIPPHSEMAYTSTTPDRVLFACHTPPQSGGETPIADTRRIFSRIPRQIRRRFEDRCIEYVQNLSYKRGLFVRRSWPDMFETHDPDRVEALCTERGIRFRWKRRRALELLETCSAVRTHPKTGEKIWFNQAHNFHQSFSYELKRAGQHMISTVVRGIELTNRCVRSWNSGPFNARYGDGTPILDGEIEAVRKVIWQEARTFQWEKGDLLVLENALVAHGRLPFKGDRRILVSLATAPSGRPSPTVPLAQDPRGIRSRSADPRLRGRPGHGFHHSRLV